MLISVAEDRSQDLLRSLQGNYLTAKVIGLVNERASHSIVVGR